MFGKSNEPAARRTAGDQSGQSLLQAGVVVRGDIEAKGDIRLDGKLEGKVRVTDRLTIGSGGNLVADVEANEVIVMGTFEGTIRAKQRLDLRKGAKVTADIWTPNLTIEEGVFFEGHSKMGDLEERIKPKAKEGEILALDKRNQKDLTKAIS